MQRFRDKAVLVTGAASGIGLATALRLAAEGARVAVADINQDGANAAAAQIKDTHGTEALALSFDAADAAQCADVVAQTVARFGRLDVVVNNAGIMDWGQAHEYDPERFDRVLKINLYSVFHVSRAALPHLLESKGNIVNMSSAAGLQGVSYACAYSASKSGVLGLTRSLAMEYADQNVRVNAVCPGAVDTPLTRETAPVPPWADMTKIFRLAPRTGKVSAASEIAAAVAYLASDEACNVTGIALPVDGGQTAG